MSQERFGCIVREAAITALAALIDSSPSVNSVKRDADTDLLSANDFPCVVITDNGAERLEYKTGGMADVYVTLDLAMMVQTGENQSTALNALDVAIKTKIASNQTLSGTVAWVAILPQDSSDTMGDDNFAVRKRKVTIFYEASVSGGM